MSETIKSLFKSSAFLAVLFLYSGANWAHETENPLDVNGHIQDDTFFAEQARLRASTFSYQIDHWQENFGRKLKDLSSSLVSEIVSSALAVGSPKDIGQWGPVTSWQFAFASAANLPDGRILAWGANNRTSFTGGKFTYASIWDPLTNQFTDANHPTHSLFCGMPVSLEDGRIFVAGGDKANSSSVKMTSTFSHLSQSWNRIQDMHVGRWYNGAVAMPNGKVLTVAGAPGSQYPEIWSQASGWSYLNNASVKQAILDQLVINPTIRVNWLPHLHLAPNGEVFHSGYTEEMHYIDTEGNGSIAPVSTKNSFVPLNSMTGYFEEGKLLQAGGSDFNSYILTTTKAAVIDINGGIPTRTPVTNMRYRRMFNNQVVLPNGEVMVVGGNTSGTVFEDATAILTPEIWNPVTNTWRTVAPHAVPRTYHSVALLMTDGRVWSGGGGLCDCPADHPDSQVYSPPYLFNADGSLATRPEITSAQNIVSYGQTIDVTASPGIEKFTMIRMSSTTHALNSDMRLLKVPFIPGNDGHYSLTLHTNRNVMTPGYWMLFALNQQGVPSVAKVIKVSTSNSPVVTVPDEQTSIVNENASLAIHAIDPNGNSLTYDAVGLPQGLSINASTGLISGVPVSKGSSRVVVSVSDGTYVASASFVWNVLNNQSPPVASAVFGNTSGTAFQDNIQPDDVLTSVNIRSSGLVDAIQGVLNTGALPQHGGNTGTLESVAWPVDEYLVRIYGLYDENGVVQISFKTNNNRVLGPYPTAPNIGGTTAFDFTVPTGNEVVGFKGTAAAYLNSIGVLYRPRQLRNQPPIVTSIVNQSNSIGEPVNLSVIASDHDNDALTYSATGLPPGVIINQTTGNISGAGNVAGNYDVIIKVLDAKGGSSGINFTWSIYASQFTINPVITSPHQVSTSVTLSASTVNASNPKYKWSFGDGTAETSYSSSGTISHTYNLPGIYQVKVTVSDDSNAVNSAAFAQAIHLPHTAKSPSASTNTIVAADGTQLWVVNQDNDTVSVFNTATYAKLAELTVGKSPRTLAEAPDGRIWVANKGDATVSIINPANFQVAQTLTLASASQPYGIAFAPDNSAAFLSLEALGKVLKLNPLTGAQLGSITVSNPRHLSITADSSKVLVSKFITPPLPGEGTATVQTTGKGGEVVVVSASTLTLNNTVVLQHSELEDNNASGSGIPNYLGVAAISPDGQAAWVPSKQDNVKRGTLRNGNNINFQNTVRGIASKINLTTLAESYASRLDFDNSGLASAAIYDQSGNYLFVALEATREVALVDAYDGIILDRVDVGRAPDGLALSADGNKLFVNNFMDRTISVIDLTKVFTNGDWSPPVVSQMEAVSTEKLSPTVLKGKQLFYDAKDTRLARDGYLSCAVCHNDGTHDGRVWDLTGMGEGLRNTINLRGRSGIGQGLLHWSANFDEIQDFEGQIRNLASGTGLLTDAQFSVASNTLGMPKKAGLSADLDALAAYLESLNSFDASPYRTNGNLTATAIAGKAIFISAGCGQCHGGEAFTDSSAGLGHDIGSIKSTSGKRLGGLLTALDTPTLRDIWYTAPYLHDGSAPTLAAAIRAHSSVPSIVSLTASQITQVAAYVQQIGGTEPALDQGLPSVSLTAPADSSTVSGSIVSITADASDNDGIAGVQFKLDGANLELEDSTVPYTITWNTTLVTNGVHNLTAVARDNSGNVKESSTVSVTVNNNSLPDVVVTSLSYANGVFTSTVKNQGSAPTPAGVFVGVAYSVDGRYKTYGNVKGPLAAGATVTIGTVTPYTIPNGTHTIKAWVDDINRFAESDENNNQLSQTILVGGSDTTPPTVAIDAPLAGASISGTSVDLNATASDNVGVAGVQFKVDGNILGSEDTSSPYSLPWDTTAISNGSHTLTAIARDGAGNSSTSSGVVVTVNNATQTLLPDVIVTDLTYSDGVFTSTIKNQGTKATPARVSIGVSYFVDGSYKGYGSIPAGNLAAGATATVGTNSNAYTIPNGNHTIAAWVDDLNRFPELDEDNNKLSKAISVNIVDTTPPTVAINTPLDGITLPRSTLAIAAAASDNTGIASVQFKIDGVNLGAKDIVAPYAVNFNTTTVADGIHTITAVAQDYAGNLTTSGNVRVTVANSSFTTLPDVVVTAFSYSNGVFSATVKNQGTAATPTGITIGVSYSVNGTYRTYGSYLSSIAPGASVDVGTNGAAYTIPSGTFTITAKSDDSNRFAELDETNNQVSQSITIP